GEDLVGGGIDGDRDVEHAGVELGEGGPNRLAGVDVGGPDGSALGAAPGRDDEQEQRGEGGESTAEWADHGEGQSSSCRGSDAADGRAHQCDITVGRAYVGAATPPPCRWPRRTRGGRPAGRGCPARSRRGGPRR